MVTLHPTDPETFQTFSLNDTVSVSRFGLKLIDALGCLNCFATFKICSKSLKQKFTKKEKKMFHKPETMKDVPDSDSDSDVNDTFKGLSPAAIHLGEGAILYL